jgi:predicted nuclease of restriction endonuclease-like RecB superfamily
MLTGDLVRAKVDGAYVKPLFVGDPGPALQERGEALVEAFQAAARERWTRGRLDEEVEAAIGDSRDVKLLRGLAKVLADRSEFETASPVPPAELRAKVFKKARELGPIALERGPLDRTVAADVLEAVGAEIGLTGDQIGAALYADLEEAQRITSCDVDDAATLFQRYDLALAQAVLLHATSVKLALKDPEGPRLRQLFRWIKFHQLVHSAERREDAIIVTLDGPASLFQQSTRYGLQLATFLPAVLLQERWVLDAEILWTKRKLHKHLVLEPANGLVSTLPDTGAYKTREQQWFEERWAALDSDWKLTDRTDPVDLGGKAVLLPDFTFKKGRKQAHLEIVGFWRRDWLEKRVGLLERYGPGNLVVAVSRKLQAGKDDLAGLPAVVEFAEVIPAKAVLEAVEKVAR